MIRHQVHRTLSHTWFPPTSMHHSHIHHKFGHSTSITLLVHCDPPLEMLITVAFHVENMERKT